MKIFHYEAVNDQGAPLSGMMSAIDESRLEKKLLESGWWLISAKAKATATKSAHVANTRAGMMGHASRRSLIDFFTIMSFQSRVGVPLLQSLEVASQECEDEKFRKVILQIKDLIESGSLFCEAIQRFPKVFSPQFSNIIRAGETSSRLPETFMDLKEYVEWVDQIMADVRQASLYPAIISIVVAAFVLLLFSFVVPKFAALLGQVNVELPGITQVVFAISEGVKSTWWLWTFGLFFMMVGIRIGRRFSRKFDRGMDWLKLRIPIFGEMNLMLSVSKLSHNLAILQRSGIAILTSLKHCEQLVGNRVVEEAVVRVRHHIEGGQTISQAMRREPVFPSMLLRMVIMGENTGNLDHALDAVCDYYNLVIPRRIKKIFSILEPALILFLVCIVGAVAVAVFLPLLTLMDHI